MKRVMYSASVLLTFAIATNGYAGSCSTKAQAACSAASACEWDASSQACVDKEPTPPDSAGSGDEAQGVELNSQGAKTENVDSEAGEF